MTAIAEIYRKGVAQSKIVAAAFLDAYNKLVQAARQYRPQQTRGGAGQGGQLQGPQ